MQTKGDWAIQDSLSIQKCCLIQKISDVMENIGQLEKCTQQRCQVCRLY